MRIIQKCCFHAYAAVDAIVATWRRLYASRYFSRFRHAAITPLRCHAAAMPPPILRRYYLRCFTLDVSYATPQIFSLLSFFATFSMPFSLLSIEGRNYIQMPSPPLFAYACLRCALHDMAHVCCAFSVMLVSLCHARSCAPCYTLLCLRHAYVLLVCCAATQQLCHVAACYAARACRQLRCYIIIRTLCHFTLMRVMLPIDRRHALRALLRQQKITLPMPAMPYYTFV